MTQLIGYLIADRIEDIGVFRGWAWAEDFRPDGVFVTVDGHPSVNLSPSERKQFVEGAMLKYIELLERGFKEIKMAMTLYSDAFDDYELKYLDREANPSSHDDWLALREVYTENFPRERILRQISNYKGESGEGLQEEE